jgi:hypothetical protein
VISTDELTTSSAEVHSDENLVDVIHKDHESTSDSGSDDEFVIPSRDKRQITRPIRYVDYVMFAEHHEPESYSDAMQSEESYCWNRVMDEEMDSLKVNNTWKLVDEPIDRSVIQNN